MEINVPRDQTDRCEFTPLHGAAGEEHTAMARLLIASGDNVNAAYREGTTPLHLAANPAMAKLLVGAGAAMVARDHGGNTPRCSRRPNTLRRRTRWRSCSN